MADTTWSVRVDEETKAEVINLLNSSGEQGKEFIQSLMSAYKLKKSEELQPLAAQDLKDLQLHLARVQDIYYNLTQRIDTRLKAKDDEVEVTLSKKNAELETATVRVAELSTDLTQTRDILEGGNRVIESQKQKIQELEEAIATTKALVSEYKDKNDTLAGLLAEYKSYKTEIEEIKKALLEETTLRTSVEKEKNDSLELIERLKVQQKEDIDRLTLKYEDDINRLNIKADEDIKRLTAQHNDELQRTKNTLELDQKQNLLDVQAKHQDEINRLHQVYNEQIQEIVISFSHLKTDAELKAGTVSTDSEK